MARITGRTARNRHKVIPVSRRQVRKSIKKGQLRIRKATLEVRSPISQRGRTHVMQEEVPGITIHQLPQTVLLDSTAIKRFKYWINEKKLRIWFVGKQKSVYDYFDVPESIVITLSQAQSKGNYFYYNIRTSFEFRRIR